MTTSWWQEPFEEGGETPEQYLKKHWQYSTDQEIAIAIGEKLGREIPTSRVTLKRQRSGLRKTKQGNPLVVEESVFARFNKPEKLHVDDALVISDIHAPFHDAEWLTEVLWLANKWDIEHCIVAGDLFDMAALSTFTPTMALEGEKAAMLSDELDAAAEIADALDLYFDEIIVTTGNHEQRASRVARMTAKTFKALLGKRDSENLRVSPFAFALIHSSNGQTWEATHPKNSSVIPARVAARMADKYERNIIAAHGHDWGEVTSVNGRYAAACGMCADPLRLDYVMKTHNTRPFMQQGAWILKDGLPVLLHPKWRPPSSLA